MSSPIITIIGAGNMGASLIRGLIQSGHPPDKLWATDTEKEKLDVLKSQLQINTSTDNALAAEKADVIILAIKPQIFASITTGLAMPNHPLIISIAAGVRIKQLEDAMGKQLAIVRCMPNTPALIGCGATALYANSFTSQPQKELAETILRSVGMTVWVEKENLLDVVTALSGSGPAYFFLVMEALQSSAEKLGLSADIAKQLTLQTALGAARMAFESGKSLTELRKNVTSPGGTTEMALSILEKNNLRGIFELALTAANQRAKELGETNK